MRIKIIKKLNIGLVVALLFLSFGFGMITLLAQRENGELNTAKLAGKANEYDLSASELSEEGEMEVVKNSENPSNENEVVLSNTAQGQKLVPAEVPVEESEPARFSFAAIGDSESYNDSSGYNDELVGVLNNSSKHNPDFALFTGDIISTSGANDEENLHRIGDLKTVLQQSYNNYYIAFGKHDVECGQKCADFWLETFFGDKPDTQQERTLYHSYDYLNTHFVLLSTDYPGKHTIDEQQLQWLENDLSQNKKPNTIVVQHVPPVTFFKESAKKCHDMSCDEQTRAKLLALFKKYHVDLVISGHEHAFDHKIIDGIDYVLSGQAGNKPRYKNVIKGDIYTLFTVNGEKIELEAINTKDEIIRTISIK